LVYKGVHVLNIPHRQFNIKLGKVMDILSWFSLQLAYGCSKQPTKAVDTVAGKDRMKRTVVIDFRVVTTRVDIKME